MNYSCAKLEFRRKRGFCYQYVSIVLRYQCTKSGTSLFEHEYISEINVQFVNKKEDHQSDNSRDFKF